MKASSRTVLSSLIFATGLAVAGPALANPSGIQRDVWMTPIYKTNVWMDANVSYTFETSNLQPYTVGGTADTVIHVQADDANGSFLGGNDDYGGLGSRVDLTVPTGRYVSVLVRAYNDSRRGTADLTVKRAGVVQWTTNVTFAGRVLSVGTGLSATSHVWTQEHFDGPSDNLAIVVNGSAANAINFDDDDGIGNQSWLHIDLACTSCTIVYGRFGAGSEGPGTVGWDGDIHVADSDADGLGDSFENVLTTATNDRDTDDDGLDDAAEALGIDHASTPLKLFTWGADPKQKDMFVEMDWVMCPAGQCPTDPDAFMMPASQADLVVSYFAPDIRVHLDTGRVNPATTKAEWTKWGNWGGAFRSDWTGWCNTLSANRAGVFHHYHITSGGDGGQAPVQAACGYGGLGNRSVAHELGHNLGLSHEGNTGTGKINSKPNYPSMINYGYSYDYSVAFSRNNSSTNINPTSLNEVSSGLSAGLLTTLSGGSWGFMTDPATGKIDWNRDGRYDSSVRGAPTWIFTSAPETSGAWHNQDLETGNGPAFARMSSPQRFYLFSRRTSDNKLQYRHTSSFASCSGGDGQGNCVSWVGPTVIASSNGGSSVAPAVHRVVVGGVEQLMVVYIDGSGTLWYQLGTSADVWTAPVSIDTTGTNVEPELVPAGPGGKLRLYYQKYSVLYRKDYDAATNTWSAAQWEKTPANASIAMNYGVSVTSGYEVGIAGPSWYAAIPNWGNSDRIELWRYNAGADNWTQLTNAWASGQVATDAAPSLAYVPFSTSDSTTGQFHLLYNTNAAENFFKMMKTEGNDPGAVSSRRLQWRNNPIPIYNLWGTAEGSGELLYEIGVDTNLRGAWKMVSRQIWFHPVTEGMPNILLKDQNDYSYMTGTLDCALGAGGCIPL